MNIYFVIGLLIISLVFYRFAISSDFNEMFALFGSIFLMVVMLLMVINNSYLTITEFKSEQTYIIQGKVEGYNSNNKTIILNNRKLDGELLKDKDVKNITIGENITAKIVFCPSGKIGVLEIERSLTNGSKTKALE